MTVNREDMTFRPCVGLCVINKEGKIFVGERIDNPGSWQMPQGGIDEGETVEQAAIRELREETGIEHAEIIEVMNEKLRYEFPEHLIGKLWNGKYQGQEQTWLAIRFLGANSEITLNAHRQVEFINWRWVKKDEIPELTVAFKMDTYNKVLEHFSHLVI